VALICCIVHSLNAAEHTVVIDPGHGGSLPSGSSEARTLSSPNNATTPLGLQEKDLVLELSREISRSLAKRGLKAVLTRREDTNPDFAQRAEIAAAANPAAIVSIHFNASEDHSALGTLAMISAKERNPNYSTDLEFAQGLSDAVTAAVSRFAPESRPRAAISDQHLHEGLGSNFFCQLAKYEKLKGTPKCFLEVEFIDRPDIEGGLLSRRKEAFPNIANDFAAYLSSYLSKQSPNLNE